MIIAGSDRAFGIAEKSSLVKDPLMLLVTAPRVISPGEKLPSRYHFSYRKMGLKILPLKLKATIL